MVCISFFFGPNFRALPTSRIPRQAGYFGAYSSALDCIPSAAWAADGLYRRDRDHVRRPGRMNESSNHLRRPM